MDDWDEMTTEERKRFIAIVFDEIQVDMPGITTLIARGVEGLHRSRREPERHPRPRGAGAY